ncbi:MAG: NADP-dependent isocitrate dehydrogenase, partial [Clostridia bacterium]|nr:NADP-dependent isocitrate dehydrogenase [Clostridia bacterium]
MEKIRMITPLAEMDGDEMTRVLWADIKELLLHPFVDLKTEYYDLGLPNRDKTGDQVTIDAAEACRRLGVGVKCATITPNAQRVEEYQLHEMWKSPNGTIRAMLDGTCFRAPIMVEGISPVIPAWTSPITIARHAYGDIYKNTELTAPEGSRAELVVTSPDGTEKRAQIHQFKGPGIVQGIHNTDSSIASFAHSCFRYALDTHQDLWFATKDTISKTYDHHFKDIFQEIYDADYAKAFEEAGITYFYTLIDDAIARV